MENLDYSFVHVKDMHFKLDFDQNIVDWINKHYPARNWVKAGPTFVKTNLLVDAFDKSYYATAKKIQLPDFTSSADIFWDLTHENVRAVIKGIAEHLINKTNQGDDIYLLSLDGNLVRLASETPAVDKHTDTNGQMIRRVGVMWSIRCYYEGIQDA